MGMVGNGAFLSNGGGVSWVGLLSEKLGGGA